jgi:hypothetical protein
MAIRAERVVAEVEELAERHRLCEVLFRDEDFFADPERVDAVARGLVDGGIRLGWQSGARLEDVAGSPPERLRLLRESGCRRLHFVVAPGPPPRDLLMETGARLRGAGLGGRFVFEVQEPAGLDAAVSVARSLCALDGGFETPLCRARAVPGSLSGGSIEGWAARESAPWTDARGERRLARAAFFFAEAQRDPGRRLGKHVVRLLALVRVRLGFFAFDLERLAVEASALLRTGRARRAAPVD